ncbi:MAG: rhomboid family intramembrane serine protease, partial [Bdellovibrionota bacterium]
GGALIFSQDGMGSLIPMVGASASVSAMIAFVAVNRRDSGLRYFYFISPWRGWHGFIFLPAWLLIPFYLISDITAYLTRSGEQVTGIAHSAHLGGSLVGALVGLMLTDSIFFSRSESPTESIFSDTDRL